MKNYVRYILMSAITLWVMGACSNESEPGDGVMADNSNLYVVCNQMVTADNIGDDDTDETAPIIIDDFTDGSLLYFSQLSQYYDPNFENDSESETNYLYIYEFNRNPKANWESGENFAAVKDRLSFNWENTINVGPSGNAYKFFGFYFPVDNVVRWEVEQDQRGTTDPYNKENFMKSDIMGAYHATSSIYTRMRFRLFHLMTYLKVTLYVPVYEAQYSDPDNQSYSGFEAGAMKGGLLLDALTKFNIEWSVSKSSDTEAPFVQTQPGNRSNIRMYQHMANEDELTTVDVRDYYTGTVDNIVDGKDKVRRYDFSVIFPTQTFSGNLLCFALTTPGGDVKYYYFASSQVTSAGIDLTQGTLQQLYLYLPRKTNQTVLIGAKILPWQDAQTDMTVTKKEKND